MRHVVNDIGEREIWRKAISIVNNIRVPYSTTASREEVIKKTKTKIIRHLAEAGHLTPDEIANA